jgi:hypothetical protein
MHPSLFNHVHLVVLSFEIQMIMIVSCSSMIFKDIYIYIFCHLLMIVITRDCSTSWPQIHAKSGLHKLLGSDAFFCQESLYERILDLIIDLFCFKM